MPLVCAVWWFFDNIAEGTGLVYKPEYDEEKRDGNRVWMKYRIKSGEINTTVLDGLVEEYDNQALEREWTGEIHTSVTKLKIVVSVKNNRCYLKISFVDTAAE